MAMYEILKSNKLELRSNLNCRLCPSLYEEIVEIDNNNVVNHINQVNIRNQNILLDIMNGNNRVNFNMKHDVKIYLLA